MTIEPWQAPIVKRCSQDARFAVARFAFFIMQFAFIPALFGLASTTFAQQAAAPKIAAVRVGIANCYKAGVWTQVDVTMQPGSKPLAGELSLIVPDSDGVPGRVAQPCDLMPGRPTTVRLITRFGHVSSPLAVEFRADQKVLARETFHTAAHAGDTHFLGAIQNRELVVVVGDSTVAVEETGKLRGERRDAWPAGAQVAELDQLPTEACAYEGVRAVVLLTSRPEIYRKLTADSPCLRALDQWVQSGGRLVLCAGSRAEDILAAGHPLTQFAPGRLDKMISLRQAVALETYCESRTPFTTTGRRETMRVPRLTSIRGNVDAHEADLPLVVRTARGFGQIIFLAGDPDRPPLSVWRDRPALLARLLDMPIAAAVETRENAAVMHQGYDDLAGQLRSALDHFADVRLVPFWFVASLIVVYLLLIGPGDYFFLRKVVCRMEWTWLTFPAIIVVVSVVACVLAFQLKGNQIRVHQANLIDIDAVSGQLRGTTWFNLFSPRMEPFNLSVKPRQLDGKPDTNARVQIGWLGLPGAAIGGMSSQATGPLPWTEEFRYGPHRETLVGVPIPVWSTKSLTARWQSSAAACPVAELAEADQLLTGSITNTLPFQLEGCMLAYGRSVYEIGALAPGEAARLGVMSKRSELRTWLTGWRTVFNDTTKSNTIERYHQEATPYDQLSVDVPYILQAMMFYEAAGGSRYFDLSNDYQQFTDLTNLLKADRAILIARAPANQATTQSGATLLRDGRPLADGSQAQHETVYRFIFPVKRTRE
ncbi:MAG: hypothetical protein ABFC63_11850 [Thermoguttaceae bacterium]